MAAEASKSSSSADSYIGSLISLTSKSEIRYEGVLYSINTEESSIGLRNVRSFGSEGRKKDGPQIPPSDKVYEFILFRGTDIKDLLVKSTPPVQTASNIDNDPAIIQSHYPKPPAPSTNLPPAVSGSPADMNSHTPQMGHPGSSFPGVMPLYHHGASLGSWGPSPPPSIKGNPLPMPAYWPGMYGPPNVLPHLHQQTFLPPPPGLSMPPYLQQPLPYPGLSAPPQAAAPNVASSSSPLTTNSSSAMLGFSPPPPAGALNVPNSSSPLVAASSNSHAQTSTSLPSLSLSLQQSMPYSVFNAPAQAAALNVPNSSSMPFTTISSSAILVFNPPPPAGALNVPSSSSPFLTASSSSTALTSSPLPSLSLPVVPSLSIASGRTTSSVFNKGLNSVLPSEALNAGLPTLASLTISGSETISMNPPVSSKVNTVSISTLPYQNLSQPVTSVVSSSMTPSEKEVLIPSLVTPDQLFQSEQSQISSQSSQIARKDVEVVQVLSSSEKSVTVLKEKEVQPPILPLPPAPRPYHKPNGATQVRHNYRGSGRGRGQGRGTGGSRPVKRFTEDFDFTAMNEKFNKDEVWDHLGKSNKIHSQDKEGDEDDEDDYEDEDGAELPKIEVKPVYNKDDFFDSFSSNTLGNEPQNARPRFSEQVKLDTETFGEFARYRGARGGRGARHGGRGSNYGRAYGYAGSGRGYGYSRRGRGRGRQLSSQAS